MAEFEETEGTEKEGDAAESEFAEEAAGVTFDDIVSFTMLLETAVTIFGILIFFIFFVL